MFNSLLKRVYQRSFAKHLHTAYEEAGVLGTVKHPLPHVDFVSKRGSSRLLLFVMEVSELLEEWPERKMRERKVVHVEEAIKDCCKKEMKEALLSMKREGLALGEEEDISPSTKPNNCKNNRDNDDECVIIGNEVCDHRVLVTPVKELID